jgi:transposase
MFSVELWAHILAEKFLFQRPMSRLLQVLALQGLSVSQGTVTGGLQKIKDLVYPLYTRILERNRSANHWHMDETRWLMFATVEGKIGYRWWLWVAVTEDTVVYLLDPSRSSSVPREHLGEDPSGTLSVDRYSGYKALISKKLKLSFCWGHVRRDYTRIYDTHSKLRTWAQGWIDRINLLFHLNNNRLDVLVDKKEFRLADAVLRREIDCFKSAYTNELTLQNLHPVARKALESLVRHWSGLLIFVDHPEIPMDNNLSERKLREAALGRKNYYGSGAVWSGDLTATLFTIFQTARHNGLDPVKYLTAYLHAIANNHGKVPADIDCFLPWNLSKDQKAAWKPPP